MGEEALGDPGSGEARAEGAVTREDERLRIDVRPQVFFGSILSGGVTGVVEPGLSSTVEIPQPEISAHTTGIARATYEIGPDPLNPSVAYRSSLTTAIGLEARLSLYGDQASRLHDEIVATPGLDGVYIGPADLTLGLTGRRYPTGFDREEPELVDAIRTILDKAHAAGIRACLHNGTPAYAAKAVGWGFDLVTLLNDVRLLAGAAKASVDQARKLLGVPASKSMAGASSASRRSGASGNSAA